MNDPLVDAVRALLTEASAGALDDGSREHLDQALRRLSEPVRLAFAGRVKAGKSTLLNALVGEELAPTDASECTRVVTWYVGSQRPEVLLHGRDGSVQPRPYRRDGGPVDVDIGRPLEDVDHLEIRWPSARLRQMTLIDTPGIGSLSAEVSRRAEVLLPGSEREGDQDRPPVADAVVYLLRHAHASDVRFLEAFSQDEFARGTTVNAIGVLSRADEIGSCRLDALEVAATIARRYETDARVHRLCPVVVPVAGLVAQAGVTLREEEYRVLVRVAELPAPVVRRLLLTADRFVLDDRDVDVTPMEREHLLDRFGLFGVRFAVDLVRHGRVDSANDLALVLRRRGGLERLRGVVLSQFADRSRLLTSRSAVTALRSVLRRGGCADPERLAARLEEVLASAHEFTEVRLLDELRSETLEVPERLTVEMERLLGGSGAAPAARLGLDPAASDGAVREAALAALLRWQRVAESPLSSRSVSVAARAVARTCEGILAAAPAQA